MINNIDKLIIYIDNKIKLVRAKISKLKSTPIDMQLENTVNKIKSIQNDYKRLLDLDDNDFNNLKIIVDGRTIYNLSAYKKFVSNEYNDIIISEQSKERIKKLSIEIIKKYEIYKQENLADNLEIENLNNMFELLKSLRYNLTNSFELESNDIDLIIDILRENGISDDEIMEYIIYISYKFMVEVRKQNLSEEDINTETISLEELIEIFELYGYDFNKFNKEQKSKILLKGNLKNIRGILEVLTKENIDLTDLFDKRKQQLCELFVHSTPILVQRVLDVAKNQIKLYDGHSINFSLLIERPGIFIAKRKTLNNIEPGPGGDYGDMVCGCHDDFVNNVNLIFEKYVQAYGTNNGFDKFFEKSKHSCVFEAPHTKILNIVKTLEMYEFEPRDYLRALSSFNSTSHADVLDVAIELDCFEYVKNNPSKLTRPVDSILYNNLAIARLYNISNEQLFNTKIRTETGEKYIDLKDSSLNKMIQQNNFQFVKFKLKDNFESKQLRLFDELEFLISKSEGVSIEFSKKDLNNGDSILSKLEDYVPIDNKKVYIINGITISKNKVLRLYHILKLKSFPVDINMMLYIMSRNSYLTQEQFDMLKTGMIKIMNQGEKKI